METFGSDAAPPNVMSVRRVRQCEIFVGIYGHRYGTIDANSGKSITELELDEARSAQSTGVISHLLLYVIDRKSVWLSEFADTSAEARIGRERLTGKLKQHTYTICRTETELLFSIVRDVYRSVARRFSSERRRLRPYYPPSRKVMHRPIGMEFLTSGDADYLIGRSDEVRDAIVELQRESIVLLLGESGVGKTSLIHAGIIPEASALHWRPVYTRPLSTPHTDVVTQIESSVFEGGVRHGALLQSVAEVLSAIGDSHFLLIIDQFEDVLNSVASENLEALLSGLSSLRELSEPRLHILISYRADLEGRLGTLWQRISGSARGLARVYIGGLSHTRFWEQLNGICASLGITVELTDNEAARVLSDISMVSKNWAPSGLYPPYIQMLIDFMFSSRNASEPFTFQGYQKAGAIFGVVRAYLSKQLRFAEDDAGELRLLLIALVKSYGVKAQRSLQELAADTGLEPERCQILLERLIGLRLARHISGQYEVSHDFLAKKITEELVDSEEREFKRFRELLSSRATAFTNTSNRLTVEEVLFLYKYKSRIIYNDLEVALIIETWVKDDVPGLFWIKDFDRRLVERCLASYRNFDFDPEQRLRIMRLKSLFSVPFDNNDYLALTKMWKGAHQAARLLVHLRGEVATNIALSGLRSRQGAIRNACAEILTTQVRSGQWHIVNILWSSNIKSYFTLFFEMAIDTSIDEPNGHRDRALMEFQTLQLIARTPLNHKTVDLGSLKAMRPRRASLIFAETVNAIRSKRIGGVVRSVAASSRKRAQAIILATETIQADADYERLLNLYAKLNQTEIDSRKTPSTSWKAEDVARVIRRLATTLRLPAIREMFKAIELKSSSRDIVLALLTYGDVEDVTAILRKLSDSPHQVGYQNHMELCFATKRTLMNSTSEIPEEYVSWVKSRNFSEYILREDRGKADSALLVKTVSNRPLFIRLLAHAIVGLVRSTDDPLLHLLLRHSFITISAAAASRMTEIDGGAALSVISKEVDDAIAARRGVTLASAIGAAEESLYVQSS
jgi:hypothetical protein